MSQSNEIAQQKKQKLFDEWMKGEHVLLQLNSRHPGVEVPASLAGNPSLTLKLSYLFQGETTVSEEAITSYLRFSGVYHKCVVPWKAIWGMTASDGATQVWPQDIPPEVVALAARAKISEIGRKVLGLGRKEEEQPGLEAGETNSEKSSETVKPQLKEVASSPELEEKNAESPSKETSKETSKERKSPQLTRIK